MRRTLTLDKSAALPAAPTAVSVGRRLWQVLCVPCHWFRRRLMWKLALSHIAVVFIPRELPHALLATEATRLIIFGLPAGQERYFRALSVPAPARELPPPATGEPHPAAAIAMQQTAFLNGVELLGDSPFAGVA